MTMMVKPSSCTTSPSLKDHTTHYTAMSWFGLGGAKKEEVPESSYDFAASGFEESVGGGGGGYEPSLGGGKCVCQGRG